MLFRSTSLDHIVERVVALLRVEADRAGVALRIDRCEDLPAVALDALQIEQVLLNVTLNAIQASPPGSAVRIHEVLHHAHAIVEVTDEGPGIPAEHMEQIFHPFFTTKERGTGLGLAIAQRIVLSHRGRIDVGPAARRGTCVRIQLPVHAPKGVRAEAGLEVPV